MREVDACSLFSALPIAPAVLGLIEWWPILLGCLVIWLIFEWRKKNAS